MRLSERLRTVSVRSRLTLVLGGGAVALTIALVAGFNVVLREGLRHDIDNLLTARTSAALASIAVHGNRLRAREAPGDDGLDRQVWVFYANGKVFERPPASPAADAGAAAAARTLGRFRDVAALDLRLYSLPIVRNGRTVGTVVAGTSLAPYEDSARRALLASAVLGALVLAAMLALLRSTIAAALRPVDRMTAEAAAWSVNELDHRFVDAGPRDELTRLAATFNDLLARLGASFRHEQRFSAEMSHELRTPLAKLIAEAELSMRRERTPEAYRAALSTIAREAHDMQRVIETLVAVARTQADPRSVTSDAGAVATAVVNRLRGARQDIEIAMHAPARALRLGVDHDLAERVLAPIVANAVRYAGTHAAVELRQTDGVVEFVVTDDGPGVPADQRESIFTPGFRGAAPPRDAARSEGAGLGLALARRLADAAGGSVRVDADDGGGGRFVVALPSA
jgi:signal transduction histidine kinase